MTGQAGTFVERLRSAPDTALAQFNQFLLAYRPGKKKTHAFVEGRFDPPFYGPYLRGIDELTETAFVRCENKAGVLKALVTFLDRFKPDPSVMFFVDSDFDHALGTPYPDYPYLFTTSGYSFENYFVEWKVIENYLVETAGADANSTVLDGVRDRFHRARASFIDAARPVMCWMIAVRRKGIKANFQAVDSAKLFTMCSEGLVTLATSQESHYQYLCRVTGANGPTDQPSDTELRAEVQHCPEDGWARWIRGKQAAWFVVTFIKNVVGLLLDSKDCRRPKTEIAESNCVFELSSRLAIPKDLAQFFKKCVADLRAAPASATVDALI